MHQRLMGLLALFIVPLLFFTLTDKLSANTNTAKSEINVRVALVNGAERLSFRVAGDYQLVNKSKNRVLAEIKAGEKWEVTAADNTLYLGRNGTKEIAFEGNVLVRQMGIRPVTVMGANSVSTSGTATMTAVSANGTVSLDANLNSVHIASAQGTRQITANNSQIGLVTLESPSGSKRYRGDLEFKLNENFLVTAINVLPIEEYLYGVVPSEMPADFGTEALKAQTLAARTYVYRAVTNRASQDFHVVATDLSQVYGGYDAESSLINRLIQETAGEIITYEGKPIDALFFSCSGGYTENSEEVWRNFFPYLRWKKDPFDMNDRHYNWVVNYTADQLAYQLNQSLPRLGYTEVFERVLSLEEVARTSSGARVRVMRIQGYGKDGRDLNLEIVSADRVRIALGLKSSLFTFEQSKDEWGKFSTVTINGSGWGHGIGLSQYGAKGMAAQGYNYKEILEYYYTGVQILPGYGLIR